jgi:phosphoribosylaminoimidazole-succinocarboxamide synthase
MSKAVEPQVAGFPVVRGKVRDIYDLGDRLLIVATDRLSAFDCIMPDRIPTKGRVLTSLSWFWFHRLEQYCPHHALALIEDRAPPGFEGAISWLRGRAMICEKAKVVPIECVARGYLAGSGWKEYQESRVVCGQRLPTGLKQCSQLPEPIFTPATKAATGHDENISFERACDLVGTEVMTVLREKTLTLYNAAAGYARERGIIIADTKFEFGVTDTGILWIDEALTPDSSRFWPVDRYEPGRDQESYDKQQVRNYLQRLCDTGGWNKTDPAPGLPAAVIAATTERYLEAHRRLTGESLLT